MVEYHRIAYKPHSFLAYFEPKDRSAAPRPAALDFQTRLETANYTATVDFGEREMLSSSADGQCLLLLSGTIYVPQAADTGAALLNLYERRGLDFVDDLNGDFCLLLIDRRADLIALVTDRMNSIKLLVSRDAGTLIVSNSTYLQPVRGKAIDREAVAAYLANSYIYNDRTLYEHVRMLDGSSIYQLNGGGLNQRRYWRFQYQTPSAASPESLRKDLGDLIIEATRRRVRDDRPIYLALSGGYDSSTITAILSTVLRVADVRCFTYAYGEPQPGSDEFVAGQIAARFGYQHRLIPAFDGDLVQTIQRNGRLGGSMTRPCDEVDAWLRLGEQTTSGPAPVLFTGDTLFLEPDWTLASREDIVSAARLRDFSVLSWLEPLIGSDAYRTFLAATRADIEQAVEKAPPAQAGADPIDWRDMIRFDQIQTRVTVTWREYYAGRLGRPTHPLLDNDVLDFLLRLPAHHRRGKRLYISTVTAMFPELFATPRASFAGYATYWPSTLKQQSAGIQAWIRGQPSPLDDVIDPEILLALLAASDRTSFTRSNARMGHLLKHLYRLIRRANLHRTALGRPSLYTPAISADAFLKRALTIRAFLAEMDALNPSKPAQRA